MSKIFKVAVIGCGAVSRNHGQELQKNPLTRILYCVDIKQEKAQAFSERFGGIPVADYREVLSDPELDAVHVCTPHSTHAEIVIASLEHGKHVFSEKPMAIHSSDAERINAVVGKTGLYYGVCFQNRLNPATISAQRIIEEQRYGKIVSALATVAWDRGGAYYAQSDWRGRYTTEGGGCVINQSIHTIDLLNYLCGDVVGVTALDGRLRQTEDYEVEDSCIANFELSQGIKAVGFFSNCYPTGKKAQLEIICEKARLTVDQSGLCIETLENGREFFPCKVAHGEKSEWGLSHGLLINEFYVAMAEGRPFMVNGDSAIKAVRIVEAMKNSKGRYLALP